MRKMLKRKIHPEFEVKIHKSESQTPGETGVITNDEHGVSESVTLLPTQGILLNLLRTPILFFSPIFHSQFFFFFFSIYKLCSLVN